MNELNWPMNDELALQIVQRLKVAVATIQVLAPMMRDAHTKESALDAAVSLSVSIQSAPGCGCDTRANGRHVR